MAGKDFEVQQLLKVYRKGSSPKNSFQNRWMSCVHPPTGRAPKRSEWTAERDNALIRPAKTRP